MEAPSLIMKGKPEKLAKKVRRKDEGIQIMIRKKEIKEKVNSTWELYVYLHNKSLQQELKQRLIFKVPGKILEDIHKMYPKILSNWKDVGKISTNFIQKTSECSLCC